MSLGNLIVLFLFRMDLGVKVPFEQESIPED